MRIIAGRFRGKQLQSPRDESIRPTADRVREVYFACRDFRKPSKVLYKLGNDYADRIEISYEIYKDKYWQSFNRFHPAY